MRRFAFVIIACLVVAGSVAQAKSTVSRRYVYVPNPSVVGCAEDPAPGAACFTVPVSSRGAHAIITIVDDRALHVTGIYTLQCIDSTGQETPCSRAEAPPSGTFCDTATIPLHSNADILTVYPTDPAGAGPNACPTDPNNIPTTGTITITWLKH